MKTTFLKSTRLPHRVLWEMLKAVVQTNGTESAVDGSYQNSSVLHREEKKRKNSLLVDSLFEFIADQLLTWRRNCSLTYASVIC